MSKNKSKYSTILMTVLIITLLISSTLFTVLPKVIKKSSKTESSAALQEPSSQELSSPEPEQREKIVLEYPYFIDVDKGAQIITIFTTNEEGKYEKVVRYIPMSSGKDDSKLPDGYYTTKKNKHEWQTMLNQVLYAQYTTKITGNILFHSVTYTKNNDSSSLEVDEYNRLGQAVSGGCLRMTVENAKWIYDNIVPGTTVYVHKGEPRPKLLAEILPPKLPENAKWDPSDPDPQNPDYATMYPNPDPQPDPYAPLYDYHFDYRG